jgi:hypothetical protein
MHTQTPWRRMDNTRFLSKDDIHSASTPLLLT